MPGLFEKAAGDMGETLEQQIDTVVELLELIDRKRQASGDPGLGIMIERSILNAHLWAIGKDILEDPADALGSTLFGIKPRHTH